MATGDIICFMTAVNGLDIAHVGLYMGDGRFMHASSAGKKVVEEELTLPEYLGRVRNHVGIKVARPDK
jgi:cell wall-associated NlpC family hydrolase